MVTHHNKFYHTTVICLRSDRKLCTYDSPGERADSVQEFCSWSIVSTHQPFTTRCQRASLSVRTKTLERESGSVCESLGPIGWVLAEPSIHYRIVEFDDNNIPS